MPNCKAIAICNQKGGTGKTTSHGKPIHAYDRTCRGAEAYSALADEFLRKNGTGKEE